MAGLTALRRVSDTIRNAGGRAIGIVVLTVALVMTAACTGDDDSGSAADDTHASASDDAASTSSTTSPEPAAGGLDIPELDDTTQIPVPDLGFGLAIPSGWQATLLSPEALERVGQADLDRPAFIASAHHWASTGALLYAAHVDDDGGVADLKVFVTDGVDTGAAALRAHAEELATSLDGAAVGDVTDGRVRIDYASSTASAEDPETTIQANGATLLVADGDRRWELIMTAESTAQLATILDTVTESLTFD